MTLKKKDFISIAKHYSRRLINLVRYFYAYLHHFALPKYDEGKAKGNILIVFPSHVGDAILGMAGLEEIQNLFPRSQGWHISMLTNAVAGKFLREIGGCEELGFLDVNLDSAYENESFSRMVKLCKRVKNIQFETVIDLNPTGPSGAVIFNTVAKRKITVAHDRKLNFVHRFFMTNSYTEFIRIPPDEMVLNRHKYLLHALGDGQFKSAIPFIAEINGIENPMKGKRYIILSLGSNNAMRRWEASKFTEIINRIGETYHIPIVLIGSKVEATIYQSIKDKIRFPEVIIDLIGQTSILSWVELVRGSMLLIGVDSGHIHMAAATKTPSICIVGGWDYGMFFPYSADRMHHDDCVPECVYSGEPMDCYSCHSVYNHFGHGNAECQKEIAKGKPMKCLREVTTDDVMKQFEEIVQKLYNL